VQAARFGFSYPEKVDLPGYRPTRAGHPRMIARAAELIATAERPVIYGGGGISAAGAQEELIALAERIDAPVTMTLMGKGAFPDDHEMALGMPGMHGTAYANYALHEADSLSPGHPYRRSRQEADMFAPGRSSSHRHHRRSRKTLAAALPIVDVSKCCRRCQKKGRMTSGVARGWRVEVVPLTWSERAGSRSS
jgi:thiamine pyrophosphate-dependent acetolactate synthase large subunit-like protein